MNTERTTGSDMMKRNTAAGTHPRRRLRFRRHLFALLASVALLANAAVFAAYDDIAGHWAEATINRVTELKIFAGVGNNKFSPQKKTSRAEFITVMTRALNPEVEQTEHNSTYWATKYLVFARDMGYIPEDYDIGKEHCSEPISRLEMIRLLALMIEKLEIPHDVTPPTMTDVGDLDEADLKTLDYVMTTGIIKGYKQKVMPFKTTTRAELATVILNMYNRSPLKAGENNAGTSGGETAVVQGSETSGTADAGYEIGDSFSDADAYASYKVNPHLTWKILKNPLSKYFSFVVVNADNVVIAKSVSSLPAGESSKFESFPYIEYNYANKTYWDYREWGNRVGEDRSIVIIEIDPLYKQKFDTAPESREEIQGFERVAEYISNVYRVKKGKDILKYHPELHTFATNFSNTMDENNFFGHDIPNGASFVERARTFGVEYHLIGENIAYGFTEPIYLVHAWINSPSHREHLLGDFNYSSIGIKISRFKGILATQDFIRTK